MIRIVRTTRALALASLVALLATALAQGMNHGTDRAPGAGPMPPVAGGAPMGMGMGMITTQTVDEASFLVHMIPHHREAVATAEALAAVTQRPELLALLDAIVTGQTAEIAAMEGWLDRWHPDVEREVPYAPMMRDLGPDAAVEDLERAFLEDMIGHHMMAVYEARTLLASGLAEHEEVASLARSIVTEQMREMHQMATWLGEWFGVGAPMGMGAMGFGTPGEGAPGFGMGGPGTQGMGMGGMGMGGMGTPGIGGMGMGGMGMGGMSMGAHGMGMGGMGMGGMGMGGMGMGGMGAAFGMHDATIGAAEAERLALAFLAGRGEAADAAQIAGTTIVYEVVVRVGDADRVLRIDARTGQVTLAPDR